MAHGTHVAVVLVHMALQLRALDVGLATVVALVGFVIHVRQHVSLHHLDRVRAVAALEFRGF